jgi:hypothetical protein
MHELPVRCVGPGAAVGPASRGAGAWPPIGTRASSFRTASENSGDAGFPVLHAAALDRPGNVKGGPYSDGAIAGAGQFGLVHVDDDGQRVAVRLEGRDWTGQVLLQHEFSFG